MRLTEVVDTSDGFVGSDEERNVLFWPDGSIHAAKLEELLTWAHDFEMKPLERMGYLIHRRDRPFNPDYPSYHSVEGDMSVRGLRALYRRIQGRDFVPDDRPVPQPALLLILSYKDGTNAIIDIGS